MHNTSPDFDFGLLYEMTDGDEDVLRKLLHIIKASLEDFPLQIEKLFYENKQNAMCEKAHKFKSSVAYLGFDDFSETLSALELSETEKTAPKDIEVLLKKMHHYAQLTLREVKKELKNY